MTYKIRETQYLTSSWSSTRDSIKIAASFIILHNSFFTELVRHAQETKLSVKTKTKVSDHELHLFKGW
jgi:hypothetical protein